LHAPLLVVPLLLPPLEELLELLLLEAPLELLPDASGCAASIVATGSLEHAAAKATPSVAKASRAARGRSGTLDRGIETGRACAVPRRRPRESA
jgi:hypothetical protein